ncbi:MAG: DUF4112 domain-containing protein [Myxococcota bacterium]
MAAPGYGREPAGGADGAVAPWVESLARWLDDGLRVPGTNLRFGLDPILGLLVPGLGDSLTALVALSLLYQGVRRGLPKAVLARMVLNVAVDALFGTVPVLGDLFDFAWRANRRNVELLARHGDGEGEATAGDYAVLALAGLVLVAVVALPLVLVAALAAWIARA